MTELASRLAQVMALVMLERLLALALSVGLWIGFTVWIISRMRSTGTGAPDKTSRKRG